MRDIIIRKAITLLAIAVMCLIVGIAYGLAAKDKALVIMSGIICAVNIYKILELYKIEKNNKYTVISGRCLDSVYKFIGKHRVFRIQEGDDIIEISVPRNVKLRVNEEYNLYFKKCNFEADEHNKWLKNKILSENFIGYELIYNELEE